MKNGKDKKEHDMVYTVNTKCKGCQWWLCLVSQWHNDNSKISI